MQEEEIALLHCCKCEGKKTLKDLDGHLRLLMSCRLIIGVSIYWWVYLFTERRAISFIGCRQSYSIGNVEFVHFKMNYFNIHSFTF